VDDPVRAEALAFLEQLVGQRCWSALGGGRGWALSLELGGRRRRSLRLSNPGLSFLQRTHEGTHGLLLLCPWRLDGPDGFVTSGLDPSGPGGGLDAGLGRLLDRAVEAVALGPGRADLEVRFEGGLALRALAVLADPRRGGEDWACFTPGGRLEARARGALAVVPAPVAPAPPPAPGEDDLVDTWRARWRAEGRPLRPVEPAPED
jgi:hypothetical protein